jgi:AcrR family transcriptional regulator
VNAKTSRSESKTKRTGRERLIEAATELLTHTPPSSISGRNLSKLASVHPTFLGQAFGNLPKLLEHVYELAQFNYLGVDTHRGSHSESAPCILPSLGEHEQYWRMHTHLLLDEGYVDLTKDHPVSLLASNIHNKRRRLDPSKAAALACAWWAIQLGSVVFRKPLSRGFGITQKDRLTINSHMEDMRSRLLDLPASALAAAKIPRYTDPLSSFEPKSGRGGAENALIEAAMGLFCERADTGISGRELAVAADVNYGLIHHYFGTKEAVFDQAYLLLHQQYIDDILSFPIQERGSRMMLHGPFLRGWATRELAGMSMPTIDLTGMRILLDRLVTSRGIEADDSLALVQARADGYCSVALQLGWVLCHEVTSRALNLDKDVVFSYLISIQKHITTSPR